MFWRYTSFQIDVGGYSALIFAKDSDNEDRVSALLEAADKAKSETLQEMLDQQDCAVPCPVAVIAPLPVPAASPFASSSAPAPVSAPAPAASPSASSAAPAPAASLSFC